MFLNCNRDWHTGYLSIKQAYYNNNIIEPILNNLMTRTLKIEDVSTIMNSSLEQRRGTITLQEWASVILIGLSK